MKNYVQNGKNLDVTLTAAASSGELVIAGDLVGVAIADIAANETGAIATEGVYAIAKKTATSVSVGDVLNYDAAAKLLDKTAANPKVGIAVAVSGDTVHLKIYGRKL